MQRHAAIAFARTLAAQNVRHLSVKKRKPAEKKSVLKTHALKLAQTQRVTTKRNAKEPIHSVKQTYATKAAEIAASSFSLNVATYYVKTLVQQSV